MIKLASFSCMHGHETFSSIKSLDNHTEKTTLNVKSYLSLIHLIHLKTASYTAVTSVLSPTIISENIITKIGKSNKS